MSNSDIAVLIVANRRSKNLEKILMTCFENSLTNVYVALDAPKDLDAEDDVQSCKNSIEIFGAQNNLNIKLKIADTNLGCSISVLTACDWAFTHESFLIVIEDDCLPTKEFFDFVRDGKEVMASNSHVGMIGGSQFAPIEVTSDTWSLSDYPLIWGWATSRARWSEIKSSYLTLGQNLNRHHFASYQEFVYWWSGARRALSGFVDAWDTPLVYVFKTLALRVLLPGRNLIVNVGNDTAATHTREDSVLLNLRTGTYHKSNFQPEHNPALNEWQRRQLFQISFRHIFSTKFTRLRDLVRSNPSNRTPLIARWQAALAKNEFIN